MANNSADDLKPAITKSKSNKQLLANIIYTYTCARTKICVCRLTNIINRWLDFSFVYYII